MSDCFVLYLLLTCMKKKTSGADKFTNNRLASYSIITHMRMVSNLHILNLCGIIEKIAMISN